MPGCRLGCRALWIDRNCIENRAGLFVKEQLGAFFVLFLWNGGCLAMILLAEIRLHERIIWIG